MTGEPDHWTFDRKIPVAVVITLLGQFLGFAWYASRLESRVSMLEEKIILADQKAQALDKDARGVIERVIRMEEQTRAIYEIVRRLDERRDGK